MHSVVSCHYCFAVISQKINNLIDILRSVIGLQDTVTWWWYHISYLGYIVFQIQKINFTCAGDGCTVLNTESASARNFASNLLNNFQCMKWMKCNCAASSLSICTLLSERSNELETSHMYFVIWLSILEAHVFMPKTDHSLIASGKTAHCFD